MPVIDLTPPSEFSRDAPDLLDELMTDLRGFGDVVHTFGVPSYKRVMVTRKHGATFAFYDRRRRAY